MSPGWKPSYDLPEPTTISLPGRGSTQLWDSNPDSTPDPETSPPVLLLHGWNIDAPTNYGFAFPLLSSAQRVLMYDQQGHGEGPRHDDVFTLEGAAQDAVSVLDAVGIPSAILVGYSLGGAVAQTIVHHHRNRASGLVLSATCGRFSQTRREAIEFGILAQTARLLRSVPDQLKDVAFSSILAITTKKYPDWIADVVRKGDPINLLEAGASLGRFNSTRWYDIANVPSSFVITSNDEIVPKRRQVDLASRLNVGFLHSIASGHEVPILNDPAFTTALAQAISEVANQARAAY